MHCSSELKMPSTPSMSVIMKTLVDGPVWAAAGVAKAASVASSAATSIARLVESILPAICGWFLFLLCLDVKFTQLLLQALPVQADGGGGAGDVAAVLTQLGLNIGDLKLALGFPIVASGEVTGLA